MYKASVPLATEIQYFDPVNLENSLSNFITSSPPINLLFLIKKFIFLKFFLIRRKFI